MSAHVPAWKRLGLKLKGPASGEAIPSSDGPNAGAKPSSHGSTAHRSRVNGSPASALKRKLPSSASTPNAAAAQTPNKKARRGELNTAANQETPSSQKKSVSFADGTKDSAKDKAERKEKKKEKKAKKKANKASGTAKTDTSLEPSLAYLRQWHTARDSWKFNKNHQTLLIKYLFDGDRLPSDDVPIFYQYIRDLKGGVRTRLRETAAEIKKTDMEAGAGALPASLKDKETKQKEYEETISRFLQDLQTHQRQPRGNGPSKNANGKRTLDEVEYVLRIATPAVNNRLLKRIRAEMVLGELSDSEDSATATETTTATSTSSSSASSGQAPAAATVDRAVATATTTTRQSDGSQQPAKRRRLRNVRTAIDDDSSSSSSSESESDDSESESSSSESEDTEDEEMVDVGANPAAESSSSSSSSSSEAGSESEASDESEDESASESSSSDED